MFVASVVYGCRLSHLYTVEARTWIEHTPDGQVKNSSNECVVVKDCFKYSFSNVCHLVNWLNVLGLSVVSSETNATEEPVVGRMYFQSSWTPENTSLAISRITPDFADMDRIRKLLMSCGVSDGNLAHWLVLSREGE